MSKYRQTMAEALQQVNEFAISHTVRYRDPLNKKRFAVPFKTAEKAKAKMDQLKRDGVKEIEITKDTLRGKFKEEVDLQEFTKSQMDMLKKNYEPMRGKTISPQKASMLSGILDRQFSDIPSLKQLATADIPFVSTLAKNKLYKKTGKFEEVNEEKFEVTGEVDYFGAPNPKDFEVTVSAKDAAEAKQKVMDKYQKGKKRVSSVGISSVQKVAEDTDNEKIAALRARQMMKQTKVRELDPSKDKDKIDIAKNDIENLEIKMKAIRDKMQKEMLELIDESIKSDDDYQAKKKALQDIQNDPKMRDPETKAALMKRKDKLEKDYADFKNKDKIAASKEFEKDLAAEADLTKGQIKKVHKMADELPKKDFKDRYGKEKGDAVRYATATNIIKKKEGIKEMQQIDEKIKGIENKSEKSGIPYGILKQVYNRGMAAWKGGHRPGTTPQQWAMARVNAFITKGKAYYTADADLAKKARAAKKGKK